MKNTGFLIYNNNKFSKVAVDVYVKDGSEGPTYSAIIIPTKGNKKLKFFAKLYSINKDDTSNFKVLMTSALNKKYKQIATLHLYDALSDSGGGGGGHKLPEGLVAVEYLRNTSSSFINTGIYFTSDMEIEIKCKLHTTGTSQTICGAIYSDGQFGLALACTPIKFYTQLTRPSRAATATRASAPSTILPVLHRQWAAAT